MSAKSLHQRAQALFVEVVALEPDARARALADAEPEVAAEVRSLLGFANEAPLVTDAPSTADDPLGVLGETLDDRYRVVELVAEGGFSFVYRGEHLRWGRPVAVKVIRHEGGINQRLQDAFIKEGALLAELSRKTTGIVQSYDVGTWADPRGREHLFTVLEWLEGRTLASAAKDGPWSLQSVLQTLEPVAAALEIAHMTGVAHRDVKPSNIFCVEEDGAQTTKLLDFGIAKVASQEGFLVSSGNLKALTASYAAPEQFLPTLGPSGPWTDVHALAVVCVELMLGRHPAPVDDVRGAMRAVSPTERPTPRRHGLEVSDAVEAIFARALSFTPGDRFERAGAFWSALTEATRG